MNKNTRTRADANPYNVDSLNLPSLRLSNEADTHETVLQWVGLVYVVGCGDQTTPDTGGYVKVATRAAYSVAYSTVNGNPYPGHIPAIEPYQDSSHALCRFYKHLCEDWLMCHDFRIDSLEDIHTTLIVELEDMNTFTLDCDDEPLQLLQEGVSYQVMRDNVGEYGTAVSVSCCDLVFYSWDSKGSNMDAFDGCNVKWTNHGHTKRNIWDEWLARDNQ